MSISGKCRCEANYKWDQLQSECLHTTCSSNSDCKEYGPGFICSQGECICKEGFFLNSSQMCTQSIGRHCSSYCCDCWLNHDENQACINNECRCKRNYKWSQADGMCVYSFCDSDSDCHAYDQHSVCFNQICICDDDYFVDYNKQLCVYRKVQFTWLWAFLVIPILFTIFCVAQCYKRRKENATNPNRQQNSSNGQRVTRRVEQHQLQQNQNQPQIPLNHGYYYNEPPPPYSRY